MIERVIDPGKTLGPRDLVIVEGLQRVRPDAVVVPKEISDVVKAKTAGAAAPVPAPAARRSRRAGQNAPRLRTGSLKCGAHT